MSALTTGSQASVGLRLSFRSSVGGLLLRASADGKRSETEVSARSFRRRETVFVRCAQGNSGIPKKGSMSK